VNLLAKLFHRRPAPKLDLQHPQVIALSEKLRALRAMPIGSKEEQAAWYAEADRLREYLHHECVDVYDSLPHELEHYLVDADIRAKDPGYAQHQENILADLLSPPSEAAQHGRKAAE